MPFQAKEAFCPIVQSVMMNLLNIAAFDGRFCLAAFLIEPFNLQSRSSSSLSLGNSCILKLVRPAQVVFQYRDMMDVNINDGANASGSTTEPIPSTEFARMLEEHGGCLASPEAPSGTTNPFSSSELIRRQNEQNEDDATAASQREADEVEAAEAPPNVRIILGASPSQPVTVQLHPLGDIKAGAEATSRYRRAVLDVAANASGTALPGALAYQKLFVTQSKENIGFTIQATAYVPPTQARQRIPPKDVAQLLHCTLVFDPAADRIVLRNLDDKSVTLKTLAREKMPAELGLEGKGLSTPRSVQSVEIEPDDFELLEAGPWAIHAASGQEVLEFSILARSGISIIPNPTVPSNAKTTLQGTKRQLASSQAGDPGPSKKGKLREPDKEDKATIVFQPVPVQAVRQLDHPSASARAPASVPAASAAGRELLPFRGHPMQYLHAGDKARIIGPSGEDYTVTYDKQLAMRENCHVFTAQHSSSPEDNGAAVVKVIRLPSGPVKQGESGKEAQKIYSLGKVWVQEVRNHLRLSEHPSIVRLFDAGSRLFALYMEHVKALSLLHYRKPTVAGPYCTLSSANVAQVLCDTSSALSYIHSHRIVHNDIKPDNILYSPDRGAVVIDFGLSREIPDSTSHTYHTGGTSWYLPLMLFLTGKIPLPELCKAHPVWFINEALHLGSGARLAMQKWLSFVEDTSATLDSTDLLEDIVTQMVQAVPANRIMTDELAVKVAGLQPQ
ncbi:uncharacterized protein PgNI_01060 [Pyricularia grisea]|uniref:Protein kinase domain-containing protein n=1 Tax=Pyricularia grisea TaxID=148305 RepID=A0A6P8BGI2_PYRGI|nr:uncharacterized protein PgNI_01060 [Pyricularia grisea]TLD15820.1 hypothetical protein PgNI_01060 [Pyricularia grisea]